MQRNDSWLRLAMVRRRLRHAERPSTIWRTESVRVPRRTKPSASRRHMSHKVGITTTFQRVPKCQATQDWLSSRCPQGQSTTSGAGAQSWRRRRGVLAGRDADAGALHLQQRGSRNARKRLEDTAILKPKMARRVEMRTCTRDKQDHDAESRQWQTHTCSRWLADPLPKINHLPHSKCLFPQGNTQSAEGLHLP